MSVHDDIRQYAKELGFSAVGFVALGRPRTFEKFEAWLDDGAHGRMTYLKNHLDIRADTRKLEDGMRSAIVLLTSYEPRPFQFDETSEVPIARYALGDDYHRLLRHKMRTLGEYVEELTGASISLRPAVDSAPVLERDIAERAGLGWIGKSTMLLSRSLGTYHFISELFVDIDLSEPDQPVDNHCGRCTSCIDACPTDAIREPYYVDANRCISYLTIELRGPIPREMRPEIGRHLFGCDICQEVCPWNKFAQPTQMDELQPRESHESLSPTDILRLSRAEFDELFANSSVQRTGRRGLARNAAVVLGNQQRLDSFTILAKSMREHNEPLVRGHAAWGLAQIAMAHDSAKADAQRELEDALRVETDAYVLEELAISHQSLAR